MNKMKSNLTHCRFFVLRDPFLVLRYLRDLDDGRGGFRCGGFLCGGFRCGGFRCGGFRLGGGERGDLRDEVRDDLGSRLGDGVPSSTGSGCGRPPSGEGS